MLKVIVKVNDEGLKFWFTFKIRNCAQANIPLTNWPQASSCKNTMIHWSNLHFSNTSLQSSIKRQLLLLCFCKLLASLNCISGEWIDEKHLKEYPYCGSMNYHKHDHQSSASRMVNADESKAHYRWLAVIQLDTWEKGTTLRKKKTTTYCTGAIITDR